MSRQDLMIVKRRLFVARSEMEIAATAATRAGEGSLARRLLSIIRRLTAELDFVERLIRRMP
jgi:exonuclease VII large subunit